MSHRTALALSIALTLVLAAGLFIWQDRLGRNALRPRLGQLGERLLGGEGEALVRR
jgi:hypothetical protein